MQLFKTSLILILLWVNLLAIAKVLPPEKQQKIIKTVSASIENCEFVKLGTWGFEIFVGMQLSDANAPYIRFNVAHTERQQYEQWCEKKSHVTVSYRVKRTKSKLGTTYWAEGIKENNNPAE